MRFKLILEPEKTGREAKIPLSYMYELSSAVYRILSKSNAEFSEWLHENGFPLGAKKFKLFTFSRLHVPEFRIEGAYMRILSNTVEWQISFLPERSTQEFIKGVFQDQTFELGVREANMRFHVREISVLPSPQFTDTMEFYTLSPLCISLKREDGGVDYLSPDQPRTASLIRNNLLNKYAAFMGKEYPADFPFVFDVLSKPKSALITIKSGTAEQTRVRGFMCRFRITAPIELMKIMYEAGIGEKGSMGFGMVQTEENKNL